jgi:hypothetical protein
MKNRRLTNVTNFSGLPLSLSSRQLICAKSGKDSCANYACKWGFEDARGEASGEIGGETGYRSCRKPAHGRRQPPVHVSPLPTICEDKQDRATILEVDLEPHECF